MRGQRSSSFVKVGSRLLARSDDHDECQHKNASANKYVKCRKAPTCTCVCTFVANSGFWM